jgi:hypothetical protein
MSFRNSYVLRKTLGESFAQYDKSPPNHLIMPFTVPPRMSQNPPTNSKIRLVSENTPSNRAVFYCVPRDEPDAKPANFGIKNRARAHAPHYKTPGVIDIEPPAKVPYINGLTDRSTS